MGCYISCVSWYNSPLQLWGLVIPFYVLFFWDLGPIRSSFFQPFNSYHMILSCWVF